MTGKHPVDAAAGPGAVARPWYGVAWAALVDRVGRMASRFPQDHVDDEHSTNGSIGPLDGLALWT
jgi:hypothetical protein